MSAVLEEKFASFQFTGDWTSVIEENLKDTLLNTWQEWGFEEIDEEFIIFVLVSDVADSPVFRSLLPLHFRI